MIWETFQTKKFKCLPSTIQVLFGRGRYLVEINIMTSSKLTHFNHPIKVELLLSQLHPHSKRFVEAADVANSPVVRVLLHVELGQLGLLLVVELLVRVRHRLPTRACNVFSVITESSQYKSSGRPKLVLESLRSVSSFSYIQVFKIVKPRIFEMLELCMSGQVFKIFLLSSLAQIMNAFIGLCEHVVRIFKQILDSLLLPRVHCLLS